MARPHARRRADAAGVRLGSAGAGVAALLIVLAAAARAEPPPSSEPASVRAAAEERLALGQTREAVALLREAVARHPGDPDLPLLLSRAYLGEGNLFWAERALTAWLARSPDDARARSWLALVHLRQGDPELARADLATPPVPAEGPEASRRALLSTFQARLAPEPERALSAFRTLGRSSPVFPEDREAWLALRRQADPWAIDSLSGEAEVGAGWTSNALAGSPTDPGREGTGSGLLDATVHARFAPPAYPAFRPVLELDAIGHGLGEEEYRELSSLEARARAGGMAALGRFRVLAGYRAELLYLDQTPSLFSEAQRGELELETSGGLTLFGGAGHRRYRDPRRTRTEWDAGGGGPLRLGARASAAVGATVRGHAADSEAYDLLGLSVAAAVRVDLGGRFAARLAATFSADDYPRSGGTEGLLAFGTTDRRRDLSGKLVLGLWLPPWKGLRLGVDAHLARRDSTADDRPGFDYDYDEARVRLLVRFSFAAEPWAPRVVRPEGHVPLDWGLTAGAAEEAERILDLLRQDEDLRRGSSCGL